MSEIDLTQAVAALRAVFDSQQGSYLYTKGYLVDADLELMAATVAPPIAGQVRQATADTIARAIEARVADASGVNWTVIGDWFGGMEDAAAIARRAGDGDGTATTAAAGHCGQHQEQT